MLQVTIETGPITEMNAEMKVEEGIVAITGTASEKEAMTGTDITTEIGTETETGKEIAIA